MGVVCLPQEKSATSGMHLSDIEVLTVDEFGCNNKPGYNNGHCVTDGTHFLCANYRVPETVDCVKIGS